MRQTGALKSCVQLCGQAFLQHRLGVLLICPPGAATALSALPLQLPLRALPRFACSTPLSRSTLQRRSHCAAVASPSSAAEMLAHTGDIYDGIAVDAEKLPDDPAEFSELLEKSLEVRHFTLSSFTCCSASQMPIAKLIRCACRESVQPTRSINHLRRPGDAGMDQYRQVAHAKP